MRMNYELVDGQPKRVFQVRVEDMEVEHQKIKKLTTHCKGTAMW
jgi:hypothetical protein